MIKLGFLTFFLMASLALGAIVESHIDTQSRIGYHTVAPTDLSSHRHELDVNYLVKFPNPWSLGFGLRALVEAAYASNSSRYPDPVRTRDSQDIILRDLFLQYKGGPLTLKLGSQQVVWGEAFGFYYADLVNPKDFRDFGIGPLDRNRLHIPMINAKLNFDDNVIQLIYVPKPFFNKTPSVGSDFAFPFSRFFPSQDFTFNDERTLPVSIKNAEYGVRLSPNISGTDLSFIYFNYFDRAPVYESENNSGSINVLGKHLRLETLGLTLSLPLSTLVLRSEILFHRNKYFNYFDGSLKPYESNQWVGVLGLDYIVGDKWRLGLQVSENYRDRTVSGAIDLQSTQLITAHGSFTIINSQVFDLLYAYAPHDGSSLTELSYLIPLSKRVEILFAADLFNGGKSSQFGLFHPASRGYIQLKTYLGNETKI